MPSKLNIDSFHNVIDFAVENQAQQIHLPFFEEYGSGGINSDIIKLENDKFEVFLVDLVKNYFNGLRDRIKIYLFEGIIENLENRTRKEVCSVGTKTLALYSSGDIYPCSELILPDYKLGNINDESIDFSKIKHNNIVDFFSKLTVDTIEKCSDCEFRYYCGGGCRVHANIGSGRFDVEDNYCSIIKLLYNNILNQISR
jgi:radical SAM protein with 4Fe4S-binding SPASM domain